MAYLDDIMQAFGEGDLETTLSLIEQNEEAHGFEADFLSAKAMVAIAAGEYQTAINLLLAGYELYPKDGDILCNLGFAYEQAGDEKNAYRYYRLARTNCRELETLREVDEICQGYERRPDFEENISTFETTPTLVHRTMEELREMDFGRKADNFENTATLLRRAEFGFSHTFVGEAIHEGIDAGFFTSKNLVDYVNSTDCHQKRLRAFIKQYI